jgi:hypothetical protein
MSYSMKYTHQITYTFNGRIFERRFVTYNSVPSSLVLSRIDGEITKVTTIPHY